MSNNISCPVSSITVNENRVRVAALFVFIASLSYLVVSEWVIPAVLAVDFFLRATAFVVASTLVVFSFLESALGFCAGCHVYSLIKRLSGDH